MNRTRHRPDRWIEFRFRLAPVAGLLAAALGCAEPAPPPPAAPKPRPQVHAMSEDPAADQVERKPAQVGDGAKGHYGGAGLVSTPISAYFRAQERIAFEIEVPKALQLFEGLNDGRRPKDHAEFMKEIIQANGIKLPELPAGCRYVYNPNLQDWKEALQIEHPREDEK